jgi:ribosome-interacting GTPase 1
MGAFMSSNLTMEAKLAYQDYLDAKDLDIRIAKLELFLSKVKKNKATEKIVALNKSRLSKLRQEKQEKEARLKKITGAAADPFAIKHEAHCIQVMMISNFYEAGNGVGKSFLLQHLTGLQTHPGIFTPHPLIGVFDWNHIKFQLVEAPALRECADLSRIIAGIRTTDITAIIERYNSTDGIYITIFTR